MIGDCTIREYYLLIRGELQGLTRKIMRNDIIFATDGFLHSIVTLDMC